jgi:TRAP-type C4-dicarboxylate transport system substrate-binding protein
VTLAPADVYSALERGVVDGFMWPRIGVDDLKLPEVTCCIIEPGVWTVRSVLLMNLNAWQKLTPEQQKLLDDTWAEVEGWVSERHGAMATDAVEQLVSKYGMQVVRLSENEARQLREIAYDAPWKEYVPQMPQYGPQIQELARRFSKPWPPLSYQVSRPY